MARYPREELPDDKRCQAETSAKSGGYDHGWYKQHRCPRAWAEEVNGQRLCRQHAKMKKR